MKHFRQTALLGFALISVQTPAAFAANQPQSAAPQTGPETHPLGDIPDSQAFVRYTNPVLSYSLEVPEGWARKGSGASVRFTSKLNQVELTTSPSTGTPTPASVRSGVLAALLKIDPSVHVTLVKTVHLPAGPAVLARFTSAGAANEVTGRKEALENDLYVLSRGKIQVVLRLSAAQGSDNVDAWTQMARSLVWR